MPSKSTFLNEHAIVIGATIIFVLETGVQDSLTYPLFPGTSGGDLDKSLASSI